MSARLHSCDCCVGISVRTPMEVENRPGLSAIAYRTGTYSDFRASMIAALTSAERPGLSDLTTRETDDFSIGLLDGWAIVADVLSFYNERLVHESYLRTARDRVSLQELGKLIGYQLRSGAAASTHLAFAIERPPAAPPGQSQDPGAAAPNTPEIVTLNSGLQVQSIPGPGEKPQTFETVETIEARPEWNAIPASTTLPSTPVFGDTVAWLAGDALNLTAGDILLLAGGDVVSDRWDVRILEEVIPDDAAHRSEVRWSPGLGSFDPHKLPAASPEAFVLRKRINVFGHNAPMWLAMSEEFRTEYPDGPGQISRWPDFEISAVGGTTVDLDGSHPGVVVGSWGVLSMPTSRELWKVERVAELSRAEFATSGTVTRLTLTEGENYAFFRDAVRETTVFAVSERLVLADGPDTSPVSGHEIEVGIDVSDLTAGRSLIVRGTTIGGVDHSEVAEVASVRSLGGRWGIELVDDLSIAYERSTVVVHGNVAPATHGETVTEILGSGAAGESFQRFELSHSPLTFVQSADPSGTDSTLKVRVNETEWDEAPTLYGSGRADRHFVVRLDATGRRTVRFGDGARGARLPTGSQNIRAKYRRGLGQEGNVGAGAISQLLDRPLGANGVTNPAAASGGVDPENEESARTNMPLNVRTLGRAVSLLDYADFARAFTGVSKAHVAVLPLRGGRTVIVTVAFTPGTVSDTASRLGDLRSALGEFGDPQVQVEVIAHRQVTFRLALRVVIDPVREAEVVLKDIGAALRAAFAFDRRSFVDPVHRSDLISVAHSVGGVDAVDIDRLYPGATIDLADQLVARQPVVGPGGTALPAEILVIADDPFDWLEEMT